ncbi:hypothetical protein MUO66_02235, partial [Candidatus Bathyarchaeota archaeon]|nr:hypothetical protein [Candidatus Bathyarchaeota archaeon]
HIKYKLMKKPVLFVVLLLLIQMAFAGGILTNTNQSAQYIRMLSRNASTDIDAVYFNPAGLIQLGNGWHFGVYNQTIFQEKIIDSNFPLLSNNGFYKSTVQIPVFPTLFAVYKINDWAFSVGFGTNGGDGLVEFDRGLPSFEIPVTKAVPRLEGLIQIDPEWDIKGYDANLSFNGNSVFWGIQLGATYKVNEFFSVYGGVRYLPSRNNYDGSIQDVQLNVAGQMFNAPDWLNETADIITNVKIPEAREAAAQFGEGALRLQDLITGGGGSLTLDQLEGLGYIQTTDRDRIEEGLQVLKYTPTEIAIMDVTTIQSNYSDGAVYYNGLAANQLPNTATDLRSTSKQLSDKEVISEQTGASITPMIGINLSITEDVNIALKYEMGTILKLTNDTKADDLGLFPDGGETNNNIPAFMGIGIGYTVNNWLETQLSYNMYFDKGVEWGYNTRDMAVWRDVDLSKIRTREIINNMWELGLGLQFNVTDNFALSVGGLRSKTGVADSYQSDFGYSNPSFTAGAGLMWKVTKNLALDVGFSNTFYEDQTVGFTDPDMDPYTDTFGKTTMTFAFGLSYSIF